MKIKQFLKPDWRKFLLFAIFLFSAFYLLLGSAPYVPPEYRGLYYYVVEFFYMFLAFPIFFVIWSDTLILIIEVIYLYLLSCLIVWIYDKYKKE